MITVIAVNAGKAAAGRRACFVLDQFLPRIGPGVWAGYLSKEGVDELCGELKKSASRMSAIHLVRERANQFETLAFIGNTSRFNDGVFSIGKSLSTRRAVSKPAVKAIRKLAELAAIWHDVGKANGEFQAMLRGDFSEKHAYRHHTLSHAAFEAYGHANDLAERDALVVMPASRPAFHRDDMTLTHCLVSTLVLTHHMLPAEFDGQSFVLDAPAFGHKIQAPSDPVVLDISSLSRTWCEGAMRRYEEVTALSSTVDSEALSGYLYMARAILMLADHATSAMEKHKSQDAMQGFEPGNSYAKSSPPVTLDTHLASVTKMCGSAVSAFLTHRWPWVEQAPHSMRRRPSGKFSWQYDAEVAVRGAELKEGDGFFGVLVSGTGTGKTQGGYRIMSALAEGKPRFTLALGYGALAIQAGVEYRQEVGLALDQAAIFVGRRHAGAKQAAEERLAVDGYEMCFEGGVQSRLDQHTPLAVREGLSKASQQIVNTPVATMTIDHIIEAMEANRGSYVSAALRVATADLLIDEIDSFALGDIHAIGRLIYLSGLYGRKVVISSATVTPEIVQGLFSAYQNGYQQYQRVMQRGRLYVGAFSHLGGMAAVEECSLPSRFDSFYDDFSRRIAAALRDARHRNRVKTLVLPKKPRRGNRRLNENATTTSHLLGAVFPAIWQDAYRLALQHCTAIESQQTYSSGFIRFNLNKNAQSFTRWLCQHHKALEAETGACIRINYYGARLDSAMRQYLEKSFSVLLQRKNEQFRDAPTFQELVSEAGGRPIIVLVITTPIIEIGRDYDFDFAVLEPASDMSLIQSAGRVLRHRQTPADEPNISLMDRSLRYFEKSPSAKTRLYGNRGPGVEQINPVTNEDFRFNIREPADALFSVNHFTKGVHPGYRLSEAVSPADKEERRHQVAALLGEHHLSLASFSAAPIPFMDARFSAIRFRYDANSTASKRTQYEIVDDSNAQLVSDPGQQLLLKPDAEESDAAALLIKPPKGVKHGYMDIYSVSKGYVMFDRWLGWR